jgi:hypothetical protein
MTEREQAIAYLEQDCRVNCTPLKFIQLLGDKTAADYVSGLPKPLS